MRLGGAGRVVDAIAAAGGAAPDADLTRPLETFTSMNKARRFGFLDHQDSERSFLDLFDRLRAERVIPALPTGAPALTAMSEETV